MARIAGGIAGWLAGLFPLVVVNALGALGALDSAQANTLAAIALLLGPVLGGLVAGSIGGREGRRAGRAGRAGAGLAGGIAAALYLLSLAVLVVAVLRPEALPILTAEHPIRTMLVVVCMISLAGLLLAVAFAAGAWAGRRARASAAISRRQPAPGAHPGARAEGAERRAGYPRAAARDDRAGYGGPASGGRPGAARIPARRPAGGPASGRDPRR